jgi:hypothetical protein
MGARPFDDRDRGNGDRHATRLADQIGFASTRIPAIGRR